MAALKIPPGHFPRPGECRVWIPGRPPGHQPQAAACHDLPGDLPAGAWILYRPWNDPELVEVTAYHEQEPDVVLWVRYFDTRTGEFLGSASLH
jgi:hypothetical protein